MLQRSRYGCCGGEVSALCALASGTSLVTYSEMNFIPFAIRFERTLAFIHSFCLPRPAVWIHTQT